MTAIDDSTTEYLLAWIKGIFEPMLKKSDTWKYCRTAKKYSHKVASHLIEFIENTVCQSKDTPFLLGEDNKIYVYNGAYYEKSDEGYLYNLIRTVLGQTEVDVVYRIKAAQSATAQCLNTMRYSPKYSFIPDRRYICFNNGVLDLNGCKLKKFSMQYHTDIVLDFDYIPESELYREYDSKYGISRENNPAKLWEWKIAEIIPNKEMRDAFQQFCGTFLLEPDVRPQFICYLVGNGGNGKSVVADVIAGVFGDKYFSHFTLEQLLKDSDKRVNIASLRYKIANFIGDLTARDMSGGNFKNFVSGGKFEARWNGDNNVFPVRAVPLLCCANDIPMSKDDSEGNHRRPLVIQTTTRQWTEDDKDPLLTRKLTVLDARRYIFTWILKGMQKIRRNGGNLKLGKAVTDAQERLKIQSNSMRMWWNDYEYAIYPLADGEDVSKSGAEYTRCSKIYADYKAYCKEYGYTAEHLLKFGQMLSTLKEVLHCPDVKRRASNGMEYLLIKKQ